MLDVKFIRENPELVQSDAAKKGYDISIKDLLKQDETRRKLKTEADEIRKNRNAINEEIKQAKGKPDASLIEKTNHLHGQLWFLVHSALAIS